MLVIGKKADDGGGRNWKRVRLAFTIIAGEGLNADQVGWLKPGNNKFTVASACKLLPPANADEKWEGWRLIWRLKIQ